MSPTAAPSLARLAARAVLAACLGAAAGAAAQDKVVIYRCTDPSGAVTLQNDKPCPKGSQQVRRVMDAAPASVAAPRRPSATAEPTTSGSAPEDAAPPPAAAPPVAVPVPVPTPVVLPEPIPAGERQPPPVLWECRTFADQSYLSESREPQQRCVTTSSTGGLVEAQPGQACEMRTDECVRIPDQGLCDAWRRRLQEAESSVRYGTAANRQLAELEVTRLRLILRDSTCGG